MSSPAISTRTPDCSTLSVVFFSEAIATSPMVPYTYRTYCCGRCTPRHENNDPILIHTPESYRTRVAFLFRGQFHFPVDFIVCLSPSSPRGLPSAISLLTQSTSGPVPSSAVLLWSCM